jgi:hypothetical protein
MTRERSRPARTRARFEHFAVSLQKYRRHRAPHDPLSRRGCGACPPRRISEMERVGPSACLVTVSTGLTNRDQPVLTRLHLPSTGGYPPELGHEPTRTSEALPNMRSAHLPQPRRPFPPSLRGRARRSAPPLRRVPPRVHRRRPRRPTPIRQVVGRRKVRAGTSRPEGRDRAPQRLSLSRPVSKSVGRAQRPAARREAR